MSESSSGGVEPAGQLIGMATEGLQQSVVTPGEAGHDVVEGVLHLIIAEREHSADHRRGARLLLVVAFVARHEQLRHDAGGIGPEAAGLALDQLAAFMSATGYRPPAYVLQCGEEGERRLGPLIEVRPVLFEPVEASAGRPDPT